MDEKLAGASWASLINPVQCLWGYHKKPSLIELDARLTLEAVQSRSPRVIQNPKMSLRHRHLLGASRTNIGMT
jgi:hypothetical protein